MRGQYLTHNLRKLNRHYQGVRQTTGGGIIYPPLPSWALNWDPERNWPTVTLFYVDGIAYVRYDYGTILSPDTVEHPLINGGGTLVVELAVLGQTTPEGKIPRWSEFASANLVEVNYLARYYQYHFGYLDIGESVEVTHDIIIDDERHTTPVTMRIMRKRADVIYVVADTRLALVFVQARWTYSYQGVPAGVTKYSYIPSARFDYGQYDPSLPQK